MHHTGHILSAVASLFICTTAFADGGMTGGGGGLVLDRNNPWFMQNTKDVKYCVEVSTDQFSATGDLVQKSIDGAIRYWNEEYASAVIPVFDTRIEPVRIATQDFRKVGCGESPDIVFQFGVMHPGQEKDIPHSEEFAGATIRTKYDPVNMKGAGYIYISPDRGPWRFKGAPKDIQDFWSYGEGGLLFNVLVHEMGHVFGLQHTHRSVMSERYIEHIMTEATDYYAKFNDPMPFFKFNRKSNWTWGMSTSAGIPKKASMFFAVPAETRGIYFQQAQGNTIAVDMDDESSAPTHAGTIYLEKPDAKTYKEAQSIYLPEGNNVFHIPDDYDRPIKLLFGPQIEFDVRNGVYISRDGKTKRDLVIGLAPGGADLTILGGVINGRIDMNILNAGMKGKSEVTMRPTIAPGVR
ncbi:MAG: matrixin family metalloprotease [Pseudomonadota bacterium]